MKQAKNKKKKENKSIKVKAKKLTEPKEEAPIEAPEPPIEPPEESTEEVIVEPEPILKPEPEERPFLGEVFEPEPEEQPLEGEPLYNEDFEKLQPPEPPIAEPIQEPGNIDEKPKSIVEEMSDMKNKLKVLTDVPGSKEKTKNFKMPSNVKRQVKNLQKMMTKDKVQVLMLKLTGAIHPVMGEINAGRLIVGERYWNAADDFIWFWMNKVPTAIICDWDMQPLTRRRLMDDTESFKSYLHPQTIAIRAMMARLAEDKLGGKKMKLLPLIMLGVAILIGYYMFFGGA